MLYTYTIYYIYICYPYTLTNITSCNEYYIQCSAVITARQLPGIIQEVKTPFGAKLTSFGIMGW